jgi:hypothetical protein
MTNKPDEIELIKNGKLIVSSSLFANVFAKNRVQIVPTCELLPPPLNQSEFEKTTIPTVYALDQAYPNPFNPSITIRYQLPSDSRVSFKIYNFLGQLVSSLMSQKEQAGYKQVEWNASTFTSSIYFYRLEASSVTNPDKSFTQAKKMVLYKITTITKV